MVQYLDLFVSLLGILYLWWEYRAHWLVWVAGIIMPAIDIYLYYEVGLYGDMAISVYYLLAAFYGLVLWTLPVVGKRVTTSSGKQVRAITSMPRDVAVRLAIVFFLIWGATWWFLDTYTNSTVPVQDALTNAISIVAMWTMAQKYLQQWWLWFVVNIIDVFLLAYKGLPFKAGIHVAYTVFAVLGYLRWRKMMKETESLNG
ncbi:MAG: nicotinamide mononucleotide transporter [Bacteroidaceae bacterium]|nr:nicotinamide mononucleotide transporter [Bacteroidaceae bacterium]